jgi:hypothetical protein
MGLFDSDAVASAFKTTSESADEGGEAITLQPSDPYGTKREKYELAVRPTPRDMQIYRFTIPIDKHGNYKDWPELGHQEAMTTVMEMISEMAEDVELVGNQEWLQQWDTTHDRLPLSEIEGIYSEDILENYCQNYVETTRMGENDHWRFALSGIDAEYVGRFIADVKKKLRSLKLKIVFEQSIFSEILEFDAGWLSGADAEIMQKMSVGVGIFSAMAIWTRQSANHYRAKKGLTTCQSSTLK